MEISKMKYVKRSLIIVILVVAILITSSGVALYVYLKNFYRKSQEIENYLSNYARNPSIVYSNEFGIYFPDRKVYHWDIPEIAAKADDNAIEVCHITEDYVYYLEQVSDRTHKKNIYRADHSFASVELVFSFVGSSIHLYETGLSYKTEDGTRFFYSYQENQSSIGDQNNENKHYFRERTEEKTISNVYTDIITDKETGVERKINQRYIDNIEKDEFMTCLADMGALNFHYVRLHDEDVYIVCRYGLIGTLFEYDFENEKMYFVDWFMADTDSGSNFRIHFIDDVKLDEESKVDN